LLLIANEESAILLYFFAAASNLVLPEGVCSFLAFLAKVADVSANLFASFADALVNWS
jgi:hypothetical protein